MKICPQCRKTYNDESLNFCLDDGSTLTQTAAFDSSLPATVLLNQPRPTAPNQSFGNQPGEQSNWHQPRQFSSPPTAAKKPKTWLWVVGILGGLI